MTMSHAAVGDTVRFSKTVSESDVYLFAGITGDFSQNHLDAEFMRRSIYGQRIAHGALLVGYMSNTSTRLIEASLARGIDSTPVSLGYDRIRFLKPVFFGDTVHVTYTISSIDEQRRRTVASIEIHNQREELVAVADHVMVWTKN